MIDVKRIEEMKRLSAEATEGAWKIGEFENLIRTHDDVKIVADAWRLADNAGAKDAKFIAESRQFVPDIIAAYEEQAKELKRVDDLYSNCYISRTHYKNIAYEQAEENGQLKQANSDLRGITIEMSQEIAKIRKALEFYADKGNHRIKTKECWEGTLLIEESVAYEDYGDIAREALV